MYNAKKKKKFLVDLVKEAKPAQSLSNLNKLFNPPTEIPQWKDPD